MRLKEVFICSILLFFLTACSTEQTLKSDPVIVESLPVDSSNLVAVQDNIFYIYNAYEQPKTFNIEPCQFCKFDNLSIVVPAQSAGKVGFTYSQPGDKTIVIRDKLNNYYAKTSFTVES